MPQELLVLLELVPQEELGMEVLAGKAGLPIQVVAPVGRVPDLVPAEQVRPQAGAAVAAADMAGAGAGALIPMTRGAGVAEALVRPGRFIQWQQMVAQPTHQAVTGLSKSPIHFLNIPSVDQ